MKNSILQSTGGIRDEKGGCGLCFQSSVLGQGPGDISKWYSVFCASLKPEFPVQIPGIPVQIPKIEKPDAVAKDCNPSTPMVRWGTEESPRKLVGHLAWSRQHRAKDQERSCLNKVEGKDQLLKVAFRPLY